MRLVVLLIQFPIEMVSFYLYFVNKLTEYFQWV